MSLPATTATNREYQKTTKLLADAQAVKNLLRLYGVVAKNTTALRRFSSAGLCVLQNARKLVSGVLRKVFVGIHLALWHRKYQAR